MSSAQTTMESSRTTEAQASASQRGYGVLFGYPIAHSFAPFLHQTVFDSLNLKWDFSLFESKDINAFLKMLQDPRCYGSAVTMPHKVAILKHLDELTPEGRDCGACNTVVIRKNPDGSRRLIGTNTDVVGIREAFYQNVEDPSVFENKPGMVIGGGGAARSAVYALRRMMNCKPVYLVNRDRAELDAVVTECKSRGYGQNLIICETVEEAEKLAAPACIVSCIPDFPPKSATELQARNVMEVMLAKQNQNAAFLEMCYHPSPYTELGKLAEAAGWQVILGTEAMIWQGLEQDMLWSGKTLKDLPVEKVKEVIARKLSVAHL